MDEKICTECEEEDAEKECDECGECVCTDCVKECSECGGSYCPSCTDDVLKKINGGDTYICNECRKE